MELTELEILAELSRLAEKEVTTLLEMMAIRVAIEEGS